MARGRLHIFIIDGTLSRLHPEFETSAGLLYRLLEEGGPRADQTYGYNPGIQGEGLGKWLRVAAGIGINLSVCHGYSVLCSRYRPGDRIMLFGYSRGAYAVRSLAGFIGKIGLIRRQHATERRVQRAFRYYETERSNLHARQFSDRYCHRDVPIEMIGVWDTVAALGLPYPVLNRLAPMATAFHDHRLGPLIRNACQALALDETRLSYTPILWTCAPGWRGRLEQVWFAGAHSDVGGQVWRRPEARPLANIPFVWMLDRAESLGLRLPDGWRDRYPGDPAAPMVGDRAGPGKLFLLREPRLIGQADAESIHPSVFARMEQLPDYRPRAYDPDNPTGIGPKTSEGHGRT
ncbi:DUF2235 domain-containing protein [Oceanomicrobium pacificus]|uniref:DUF2235 domain-containing protein n=1 Tax=Oceanomicrobium pacificus TaxID=2692916 RepID=A0A6B0TYF8_9RHOB|nr:DUF2235 domain-containing protein [Oceanomicrobium pacificus]MXU66074.1 DUF2235 domain-containing protein [Oceanomicrobium pacificus]